MNIPDCEMSLWACDKNICSLGELELANNSDYN